MKPSKFLKITMLILLIAASLLTLMGCNMQMNYELSRPESSIANIEMVEIEDNIKLDDIVGSPLDANMWSQFLTELYDLECRRYFNDPPTTIGGIAYRITYDDGSYELICSYNSVYYEPDTENWDFKTCYFDSEGFEELEFYAIASILFDSDEPITREMQYSAITGAEVQDDIFVPDNSKPLSDYDLTQCAYRDLYRYFGAYTSNLQNIIDIDYDILDFSPHLVNLHFPIQCLREVQQSVSNDTTITRYYTVYKVKEGGHFYVFWSVKNGELRICYAGYLPEVKSVEDFDSLIINESDFDDVYAIDPSADFRMGSSHGPYSYHLLTTGELLKIEYDYSEFGDMDDLTVVSMTVLPEDDDSGFIAQVYESDLPK